MRKVLPCFSHNKRTWAGLGSLDSARLVDRQPALRRPEGSPGSVLRSVRPSVDRRWRSHRRRRHTTSKAPSTTCREASFLLFPSRPDSRSVPSAVGQARHFFDMRLNKVEVNLRRLLEAAPRQQNPAKLVHYVTTARELLEQLGAETTPEGISSVSKAKLSEYSEKIEALADRLAASVLENEKPVVESREEEISEEIAKAESTISLSSGLRRRSAAHAEVRASQQERKEDIGAPIKLDAEAQAHIEKHRKLQEDLTDEMVELARQLKESSLMMNQSVQQTEKILDSTERAVEHSLASTGRATSRASEVYSLTSKTTCFQWLLILLMTCMFVMVVLLIRIT